MKVLIVSLLCCIGVLIFGSCGDGIAPVDGDVLPKIDTFDCGQPERNNDSQGGTKNTPYNSHKLQTRSPDGTKIAYILNSKIIKIITLKTGTVETYDPRTMLPDNIAYLGSAEFQWCPYDDNKLCFMFATGIDTTNSGGSGVYGQNLFILYRKENKLERIDLPYMPKSGPMALIIYGWMKGSTALSDSLFIGYASENSVITGITVFPEKKIVPIPEYDEFRMKGSLRGFTYSPDRQHSAKLIQQLNIPPYGDNIFIDGIALKFREDTIDHLSRLSWSPDGKKLAVTLSLSGKYEQVWVIDVEKWFKEKPVFTPVEKIDFQKRFCMYNLSSYGSTDAEFITNTTLAVSCHHDGDMLCPLWEITTDGRLLRQLTN